MRQQINLYQPVGGDEQKPLESRTLGMLAGGILVSLLVIWGFGLKQVAALEQSLENLRAQQAAQESALNALAAQRPGDAVSPAVVQAQVKVLAAQVSARRQALAFLSQGGAGQTDGFAGRIEALARQHTEGLWIDRVMLSGTRGAMSVGGTTLHPDLVPSYLRALAAEPALAGTRFDALTIERPSRNHDETDKPEPIGRPGIRFRAESLSLHAADPEKALYSALGDTRP